jgi:hypothetical protein
MLAVSIRMARRDEAAIVAGAQPALSRQLKLGKRGRVITRPAPFAASPERHTGVVGP